MNVSVPIPTTLKHHRIRRLTLLSTIAFFSLMITLVNRKPSGNGPFQLGRKFCDTRPCIFDLGHNSGQDTHFYLSHPDTRVLAVEANPSLVRVSQITFKREIDIGRLVLLSYGLTRGHNASKLSFWLNMVDDKFSSFSELIGCRNKTAFVMKKGDHRYCKEIQVPTTTCDRLIVRYGTPDYMKIDIEGLDTTCLRSLSFVKRHQRPKYVSVENVSEVVIRTFVRLGYRYFKVVEQAGLQVGITKHLVGYTGPWGENARDSFSEYQWRTVQELLSSAPLPRTIMVRGKKVGAWYDLHARM